MALAPSARILRLGDDTLEYIVGVAIAGEDQGGGRSLKALDLSHICRRLRRLVLARASFWTNLEIHSKTNPELIYLILQRSRELPLYIDVSGIDPGEQIFDEDTRLITSDLLDALKSTMPRFAGSTSITLLAVNNEALVGFPEQLAAALGPNPPAAQLLDICATPCDPLSGLFGPRLVHLDLREVTDFSLRWLRSILTLAPNLKMFQLGSPFFNRVPEDEIVDLDSLNACPSPQLQFLDVDVFERHYFEAVIAVIRRIYPSILSTGRRVSLSCIDEGLSVATLDLQRFTHANSLVIDGGISYEVTFLEPAAGGDEIDTGNDVVRGFQCWPQALHYGPQLEAIRHIASTVRSVQLRQIDVKGEVDELETFFDGLAQISWPSVEHLALTIYIHAEMPQAMMPHPDLNTLERVYLPRLATLDIVLRMGKLYADWEPGMALNWDPLPECLRACETVLQWFNILDSADKSVVVKIDGELAPVSVCQAVLEAIDKITGSSTTGT